MKKHDFLNKKGSYLFLQINSSNVIFINLVHQVKLNENEICWFGN